MQESGPTGPNGYSPPGAPGLPGSYGSPGVQGSIGGIGPSGVIGGTGPTGTTGLTGAIGQSPTGQTGLAGQNQLVNSAIFTEYTSLCKSQLNPLQFECNSWTQYAIYLRNNSQLVVTAAYPQSSVMIYLAGVINVTLRQTLGPTPITLQLTFPTAIGETNFGSGVLPTACSTISAPSLSTAFKVLPLVITDPPGNIINLVTTVYTWSPVNSTLYFSYNVMFWSPITYQT